MTPRKLSYSQYSMWMNCPLEYKLAYIDKLKPYESSIHLIFGTAIHHAIQTWLDVLYNEEKHKSKFYDMNEMFKEKFLELFKSDIRTNESGEKVYLCDQETLKEFYLDGCEILTYIKKYYKDFFPTSGHELVGCEIPLNLSVGTNLNYIGYIDLVVREKRSGKVIIYDFKTSGKGWYYERKDPKKTNQILLYKHFYSKEFDVPLDNIDVKFIILKRKLNKENNWDKRVYEFSPPNAKPSINKAVSSFNEFLSVFNEDGSADVSKLEPTPSTSACKFCPFRDKPDLCSVSIKE